jgi:hypothetical protein
VVAAASRSRIAAARPTSAVDVDICFAELGGGASEFGGAVRKHDYDDLSLGIGYSFIVEDSPGGFRIVDDQADQDGFSATGSIERRGFSRRDL